MLTSGVEIVIANCIAKMRKFRRNERKKFQHNSHLLTTAVELNARFGRELDEVKHQAGIDPNELYIATWPGGRISVNMGTTLLSLQVVFQDRFNLKKLLKHKNNNIFEEQFTLRYECCLRELRNVKHKISGSERARDVGIDEMLVALEWLEKEYARISASLTTTEKLHPSQLVEMKKRRVEKLVILRRLIDRLVAVHKGAH